MMKRNLETESLEELRCCIEMHHTERYEASAQLQAVRSTAECAIGAGVSQRLLASFSHFSIFFIYGHNIAHVIAAENYIIY